VSRLWNKLTDYFRQSQVSMTPTPRAAELLRRPGAIDCFPFTRPTAHTRYTFNGTVAINQLVEDLALTTGDRVLMPAYFCGSELGPFEHRGCMLDYYNVAADLQLDLDSLRAALTADTKAVFITHYFGFPQRDAAEVAALCDAHNAVLIEDCAHALFSDDAGGCDRLVYGLQQSARSGHERGGAAWRRLGILALTPVSIAIKLLRKLSPLSPSDWATADVEGPAAVPFYETRISALGLRGLSTSDAENVKATRRENYSHWLEAATSLKDCTPLLPSLPPGVCPLYFPLLVDNPATLVKALAAEGIEAFYWWPHQHPAVDWADYSHLADLKGRVIALPVHQQLGKATIARATALIQSARGADTP